MKKIYNPFDIEKLLYIEWERLGYFKPNQNKTREPFCITIPPPNITGGLHMGHAFQQTIMDIIIRYQRMQGKNTLWQVGMDHAGIATQILVENQIFLEENRTRSDYSRNTFIDRAWQWKERFSSIITKQMRRLGNSIDWEHERFTLDKGFSNAVKEVFVHLYKEKLIYRGKRMVNWDPKLCTAISDLEVENKEIKGYIWYIRYLLSDGVKTRDRKNYLVVATTRPETLLGDTGLAVNSLDPRYKNLIGKFVISPLINRRIPIIGDKYINMNKGTGCVKITPAHDFNDYEIGLRHSLPMINILTFNGNIRKSAQVFDTQGNNSNIYSNEIPTEFQKLERFSARKKIITNIETLGLLETVQSHKSIVPHSDRSGAIIEPMLTDQWYVRAGILAKPAVEAVKTGKIQFVPKQYENLYFSWMNNIKDWCISRQLWWGHRIPAWYDDNDNIYVGRNEREIRQENNLDKNIKLHQDEDVLDTWFSSSLWTFSALGWPESTNFLHQFHPTNVVVSGFDIIFFWIARMIMMTIHFIKDKNGNPQVPFKTVYITGLIRDEKGQKMSKSKGNVIDPLDIVEGISLQNLLIKRTSNIFKSKLTDKIEKYTKKQFPDGIKPYGADVLRLALASLASNSRDINWNIHRLEGCRNFCNKLWNASRFVIMNTKNYINKHKKDKDIYSIVDRWILSTLNQTIKTYREALDNFRFDIATSILYKFIWNQFCDWYLEFTKPTIRNSYENELYGTCNTLITVLKSLLCLAHPIIPFITEAIWQRIQNFSKVKCSTIMLQPFPEYNASQVDMIALSDIEWIKKLIIAIRNIRAEINISSSRSIDLFLRSCDNTAIRRIQENHKSLQGILNLNSITILSEKDKIPISVNKIIENIEILIPIGSSIDKVTELSRLEKEVSKIEIEIDRIENKLKDEYFISNAPKSIVSKEYKKLAHYIEMKEKIIKQQNLIKM